MYFCYERSDIGWTPVVYYGEKPRNKSVNGKAPMRSTIHDVPPHCLDQDGEPMFNKLRETFPVPPL